VKDEGVNGVKGLTNELRIVVLAQEESQNRLKEFYISKDVR